MSLYMKCFSIKRRYVYRSVFVKIRLLLAFRLSLRKKCCKATVAEGTGYT
ncbi:hypothetical protein HMPREF9406_0948 [Clostridium sp. HGF2]|nr:hypothetical protein HMPREF9406_0948 [Clostridium sp. HGF2]